jgi:hypothetical protein
MKTKGILFFALLGLYSCEVTDSQDSLPLTLEEKLKEVMNMPRDFPSGKLSSVVVYGGDSEQVHATREIYYPAIGNISVHVIRDRNQDTVGIGLNYFRAELLETSHFFNYENGKPVWWSTKEYQYLSGNLVDKIFSTSATKERSLLAQYRYNSQNLLTQIEYPNENVAELAVYEYDSLGRISREWKTALGQEESKIDYLVYQYSEGLLVAKESGIRGIISEDRQDAFQYFHDAQGRVIMQKEFDPYFGFQQKSRSEFFYHTSGSN